MIRSCSTRLIFIFAVVSISVQLNVSEAWQGEEVPLRPEYERARRIYANLTLATYLRVTHKLSHAKRVYEQVLREHETSAFVHTQLAGLSIAMQDIRTAERECHKAIEIDSEKPTPYFLLGQILVQRYGNSANRWKDIIVAFEKVVELDPNHTEAYQYLGEIAEKMEDYESAIHSFKALTRIVPYQPTFYLRLGSLYQQVGNKREAIAAYERAVKINHDLWQGHQALGQFYVEQFDRIFSQSILAPDQLVTAQQTLEKAIHSYSQLRRLSPPTSHHDYDYWLTHFHSRLGSLYVALCKADDAVAVLTKVLEADPDNIDANYWIGIAYQELGNFERAECYLRRTIALAPDREESYNALGYLFAEYETKLDEAVELIQKAVQKSPDNGAYLDSLGWAYFKQGRLNAALEELEKAIRHMPDSAEIQDHLGEVYYKNGLRKKAISAWQKAIQLEPDNTVIQEKLKKHQGN